MTLTEYMTLYRKTDGWIAEKTGYSDAHQPRSAWHLKAQLVFGVGHSEGHEEQG